MKVGKCSYQFNNVFIEETAVAIGSLEAKGKMVSYADIIYKDQYFNEKSFEAAERKMQEDTIERLKSKKYLIDQNIDLIFGGDLINQEITSTFVMREFDIPFVGLFGACSTFGLATIMGSIFIEANCAKKVISMASSHTQTAERTFRYPIEYGGAKEDSSTLTVTGCGAMLLSNKKSKIKVTKATIGKVIDVDYKNSFDMGGAMAPSAIETLLTHFEDFKTKPSDYDLILTGDLSQIGFSVVSKALNDKFGNVKNYDDCGLIVYDYFTQKVFSGGSGCASSSVVTCGYIKEKLLSGELNKVLICPTGALLPITSFGHSLADGAYNRAIDSNYFDVFLGMFDNVSSRISVAVVLSVLAAIIFKPKE